MDIVDNKKINVHTSTVALSFDDCVRQCQIRW